MVATKRFFLTPEAKTALTRAVRAAFPAPVKAPQPVTASQRQASPPPELERMRRRVDELERSNRRTARVADLEKLRAEGIELDVEQELTDVMDLSGPAYDRHLGRIKARYRRPDLKPALAMEDMGEFVRYCKAKGVDSSNVAAFSKAIEGFAASRK